MAIYQISKITQRKGFQADLPQPLDGGEFGWSVDERRLWIGNGTIAEGAPLIGNTEIMTEYSDISSMLANTPQMAFGTYVRVRGSSAILLPSQPTGTTILDPATAAPISVNTLITPEFKIDYQIVRGTAIRRGAITAVASNGGGSIVNWSDDYTENMVAGIVFGITQIGPTTNVLQLTYQSNAMAATGIMKFSITYFF